MLIQFKYNEKTFEADLKKPVDISIPLKEGMEAPNCFYAPLMETFPVRSGDFIGSTAEGGLVNFLNVRLNPHGNGTHTECVGHIASEAYTINQSLRSFHFLAKLVSLYPVHQENGDRVIERTQIEDVLQAGEAEALVIRTIPNDDWKCRHHYSGTNPPFIHHEAIAYLVNCGIQHLLVDLPSVDKEEDGGKLLSHRTFWNYPDNVREKCTISELIYVENLIKDGFYLLNLQTASFEIDVSPSKPVLYHLVHVK